MADPTPWFNKMLPHKTWVWGRERKSACKGLVLGPFRSVGVRGILFVEMKGGSNLILGLALIAAAVVLYQRYVNTEAEAVPPPEPLVPGVPMVPITEEPSIQSEPVGPPPERGLGQPIKKAWILVRRKSRKLSLYDGDELVKRYKIVVGRDVNGDKEREGDKRTPLGTFYVCTRNGASRFHKFLGLSYPAPEDAARGLKAGMISKSQHLAILEAHRAKRQPPWKTRLGGEIGLHGGGEDRPEGTLGCVGMSNPHIDELWKILRMGDRVVIKP